MDRRSTFRFTLTLLMATLAGSLAGCSSQTEHSHGRAPPAGGARPPRGSTPATKTTDRSPCRPDSARRCSPTTSATRGTSPSRRAATSTSTPGSTRTCPATCRPTRRAGSSSRFATRTVTGMPRRTSGSARRSSPARRAAGPASPFYNDALYVEVDDKIVRYALAGGELAPKGESQVVLSGLPMTGGHTMHPFAIAAGRHALRELRVGDEQLPAEGPHARVARAEAVPGAGDARRHLAL